MNLLQKLMSPRNDRTSVVLVGCLMDCIASIFASSGLIPSGVSLCPANTRVDAPKMSTVKKAFQDNG